MLATCICLNGSLLDQLSCTIVYLHNLFTCTFGRINMSVCLSVLGYCYEGVHMSTLLSLRGVSNLYKKKHYVALEWPLRKRQILKKCM